MDKQSEHRPASSAGGKTSTTVSETPRTRGTKSNRHGGGKRDILHQTQRPGMKSKKPKMSPSALLAQAEQCLREGRPDEALPSAKRALAGLQPDTRNPTTASLPALNLLAEINLELGDGDAARDYFLQAVDLDPEGMIPELQGGGAEKFLWLAQLSEAGGQDSVEWFEKGAEVLKREISKQTNGHEGKPDDAVKALMKKLGSALCGIVEIYMTDLSWEPTAEPRCESLITEALLSSPHSPEPLQTLASIRISQARIPEAQRALSSSMDLWKDLPPEDTSIPDFPTRISLARLLMEVEMEEEALGVVERLVGEDDQSVEAWYLGGWCLYLLGQKREGENDNAMEHNGVNNGAENDEGLHTASLISSREWLRQGLNLYEVLEYEDDRLRDHAMELVAELDKALEGQDVNGEEAEGGLMEEGDWESEEDEDEDHEMNGT